MKIFKSIKWRLQLWYGLILVVVLAGFGFSAYQLERNAQFRRIDDEMHRRVGVLANTLRRPPPRDFNGDEPPFARPPRGQFPGGDMRGQNPRRLEKFVLPEHLAHFFDPKEPNGYFFLIRLDGDEIARSTNYPSAVVINKSIEPVNNIARPYPRTAATDKFFKKPKATSWDNQRMIAEMTPSGETIWVGRSITPELKHLREFALFLTGIGVLILLIGLTGGWWLVSRALKPISNISSTATKISAGDLSQRINLAEAESELGQLAAVLNSTFARLETAFAQQKQFASDAAHELRTPVSVILTQTQMALGRERDAASYKQTVEACQRAAQRMRKLIESLLELARFDAGQETLKRLHFDFSKTVTDCVDLVQTLAEERGVEIGSEISALPMTGDSERIAQVVTNLLTNAIQYNKPGGKVRVTLNREAGLAVLKISNTGKGIAPEDLARVFERFYRADQSRTGAGNSGLGLSICKAIVEAHGGTIEAASAKDSDTTFTVRLPV